MAEAVCSIGISSVLKERGAMSEIQRAKIFCNLFSLRCILQIAFPQLREIISVTLVTVESSHFLNAFFFIINIDMFLR